MFNGIVRELAKVTQAHLSGGIFTYRVSSLAAKTAIPGASVAIDGVCQTVIRNQNGELSFEAIAETLKVTHLGKLRAGDTVHLEPAMRLGDPIDGHLVYGHIDGLARVSHVSPSQGNHNLHFELPAGLGRYMLPRGSIALDGVSLTLFQVNGDRGAVSLIPETLKRTHLGQKRPGDQLNVELDVIGKWAEKMMDPARPTPAQGFGGVTHRISPAEDV